MAFGSTILLIGVLILFQLRGLNRTLDRSEDRAREYRKAAADRAREDREANRAEHARLFSAVDHVLDNVSGVEREVSDLKADVKVLRDRSDRSDRSKSSAGPTG